MNAGSFAARILAAARTEFVEQGWAGALLRYIWRIEPLASMTEEETIAASAPSLQLFVDGDLGWATLHSA
jgi:hypothetical protein